MFMHTKFNLNEYQYISIQPSHPLYDDVLSHAIAGVNINKMISKTLKSLGYVELFPDHDDIMMYWFLNDDTNLKELIEIK